MHINTTKLNIVGEQYLDIDFLDTFWFIYQLGLADRHWLTSARVSRQTNTGDSFYTLLNDNLALNSVDIHGVQ